MNNAVNPTNAAELSALHDAGTLFREMPVARIQFDSSLRVVRWTEDAEELFGWKEDEVLGKTPYEFGMIHPEDAARVADVIQKFWTQTGLKNVTRNRNVRKDGTVIYCEWHNALSRTPDGKLESILSFGFDITERELALQRLREEREKFQLLANTMPQMAWIRDADGNSLWYNERWYEYTGKIFEQVRGWGWLDSYHPDHRDRAAEAFRTAFSSGNALSETFLLRGKDGKYRWFLTRAMPVRAEDGTINRWFGTNTDVTEERELAALLVREQRKFELVAQSMPQLVWIADERGQVEYYNDRAFDFDGIRKNERGEWVWEPAVHPDDAARTAAQWTEAVQTKLLYECHHRVKMADGTYRWHVSRAWPVAHDGENVTKWYGTSTDIHLSKEAEESIRREGMRLRRVIDNMVTFVGELDLEGVLLEVNQSAIAAAGLTRENAIGRKFWDCYWWAYDGTVVARLKEAINRARDGETVRYDETIRVAGDSRMIIDLMLSPVFDENGVISRIIPSAVDITARKEAERALREREELFRGTFENAAVGIAHVSANGNWMRVNDRLCAILGYNREELLRMTFQDITHPEDLAADLDYAERLSTGEITSYQMEKRYFRKDGEVVWANLTGSRAQDPGDGEPYYIAVIEDISERKELEFRVKAENEQKSRFLATLSHQLRNPLAPISNVFFLLDNDGLSDEKRKMLVATGRKSTDHLLRLVEDLLDMTRITRGKIELKIEPCPLAEIVADAIEENRELIDGRRHSIITRCADADVVVPGDRFRLRQIVSNLISNAAKYTKEGGRIVATCAYEEHEVRIVVEDNGPGIPEPMLGKIFDMFFQIDDPLRRLQSGLGIGLALVRELVLLHGGNISAENRPEGGARFTVSLPRNGVRHEDA